MTNRVLPNTSLTIAFRYRGGVSYISDNKQEHLPTSTISGLRKSVRLIHYLNDTATIIILFKETGAKAFFEEPLFELFGESTSLDAFIKQHKIATSEKQIAEAKSDFQRIAIIEQFLLSKLCSYTPQINFNSRRKNSFNKRCNQNKRIGQYALYQ